MVRQVIHIDEEKCNGCGRCATACHEGAIAIIDGKAKLTRDDYCDGMGDCLPSCPMDAISFETREAAEYDEKAVEEHLKARAAARAAEEARACETAQSTPKPTGCPGSMARAIERQASAPVSPAMAAQTGAGTESLLSQWPVQIKLAPVRAPYFDGAHLLIAADCTAYAYGNFHNDFIKGRKVVVGCPKLDDVDYAEKLTAIIANNDIKGVTIVRMEVPCCGGLERAAITALQNSGRFIPWQVVTISTDGRILQ